ncbi:ethanolamine ammonia-lyase subunit EutC [Adhaeribacter radiodurans]|uniref:Ethanolamine ammonia-lyase small subunit n=1 Tax=Adhaeribacter radiodurans TaxID=2745197 RepID=A0A7L7L5K1_9BACT|nr:ethanolamine ammonia-lyase subunit EutC [Adhaeribacter radiodurans]QMU28091.1 ethanolamine ammonia-lyase subunit EutC [Adhaeribacter radiodurans]
MEDESLPDSKPDGADPWVSLRAFTDARIALGHAGVSEPLKPSLQFKLAHAHARDAVFSELNTSELIHALETKFALPVYLLKSQVINRQEYLQRPDWGRKLNLESLQQLTKLAAPVADIALILADGLSAEAINVNALPLLQVLIPGLRAAGISLSPVTVVQQARVAISDEIGAALNAKVALILIGERPGLSSPDSMGAYFTYQPQPGLTDESRNCLSNIRPAGLTYAVAAEKLLYLIKESLRLQLSGFRLKDTENLLL